MRFFDEVQLTVTSGKGGDGCVSARREKGVPYGGPSGGNGGSGGSVIIQGDHNITTLHSFTFSKDYIADDGQAGRSKDQYGSNAEDFVLKVPLGTIIRDAETGELINTITAHDQEEVIVEGGRGGQGNIHFKNAINQYPQFALKGEPARSRTILLEVQMLADIGLIGAPSVGKSTLINTVSHAKAKVADYPFTTLIPNLGVVHHTSGPFTVVDIPGLIAGAAEGKGLGNDFLRHVCKTRVLSFLVDVSRYDYAIEEIMSIWSEIDQYFHDRFVMTHEPSLRVADGCIWRDVGAADIQPKAILFCLSKTDLVSDTDILQELQTLLVDALMQREILLSDEHGGVSRDERNSSIVHISAGNGEGIPKLIDTRYHLLNTPFPDVYGDAEEEEDLTPLFVRPPSRNYRAPLTIEKGGEEDKEWLRTHGYGTDFDREKKSVWHVYDDDMARVVAMTSRERDQGVQRFWKIADKEGRLRSLNHHGAERGDILLIHTPYVTPILPVIFQVGYQNPDEDDKKEEYWV